MTLNALSLFAGIGGMELGLERAGMTLVGQVEIEPYCQRVLARHWPEVPRHDDVRTFPDWWRFGAYPDPRPTVDVVCAGFPCQPFSLAGKQLGTDDERWMWPATAAAIRTVGPSYVLLENVSALVRDSRAFGTVLGDLHRLGFDAEWATLRASDFGAPHGRERVYVLAYAARINGEPHDRVESSRIWESPIATRGLSGLALPARRRAAQSWLEREPRVDRLVDGSARVSHRLRCAGNAVVPAVAEHIGELIVRDAAWRVERAA
jgi:DNA (cytosine-5)-methyltransferase 1